MAIITTCPSCKKDIGIAEKSVGKRVVCPLCKHEFTAAAPPAPAAKPAAAPPAPAHPSSPPSRPSSDAQRPPHPSETPLLIPVPQKPAQPAPAARAAQPAQPAPCPAAAPPKAGGPSGPAGSVQPKPLPPSRPIAVKPGAAAQFEERKPHRRPSGTSKVFTLFLVGLMLVIVAGGAAYLIPKMINATVTGTPRDLFNKMKIALDQNDPRLLESVVASEDLQVSEGDKAELLNFLSRHQPGIDKALLISDPLAIELACLNSVKVRAKTWKYLRCTQNTKVKEGTIDVMDEGENLVEIPIVQKDLSWRLLLMEYCLKVAKAHNKAEIKKPATVPPGAPNAPAAPANQPAAAPSADQKPAEKPAP